MEPLSRIVSITPNDPSQTGNARRQALSLALAMDFDELRQGQLGIIVTEAARNITAHAVQGEIILSGSLGPMVPVAPGDVFLADISGLGQVSATFTEAIG